jgi:hypothetical protein
MDRRHAVLVQPYGTSMGSHTGCTSGEARRTKKGNASNVNVGRFRGPMPILTRQLICMGNSSAQASYLCSAESPSSNWLSTNTRLQTWVLE